jgi:hypothetical protein
MGKLNLADDAVIEVGAPTGGPVYLNVRRPGSGNYYSDEFKLTPVEAYALAADLNRVAEIAEGHKTQPVEATLVSQPIFFTVTAPKGKTAAEIDAVCKKLKEQATGRLNAGEQVMVLGLPDGWKAERMS